MIVRIRLDECDVKNEGRVILSRRMRIAALYDIHGNLPALEAVLADVRSVGVDCIVVGGDIFPGPMARDVLHYLIAIEIPVEFIRGNGDRALVEVANGTESAGLPPSLIPLFQWHAAQLEQADLSSVAAWPMTTALTVDELGDVLFCHATPRDDNEMFDVSTPDAQIAPAFAGVDARLVICGHTHRQFDRSIGGMRVVNAGSVGMPFDGRHARWLYLSDSVELRQTPYDLADAARRVRATDYPRAEEFIEAVMG